MKTNKGAIGARVTVTTEDREGRARSFCRRGQQRFLGSSPFEQHVGWGPPPASRSRDLVADEQYAPGIQNVAMNQYIEIKNLTTTTPG